MFNCDQSYLSALLVLEMESETSHMKILCAIAILFPQFQITWKLYRAFSRDIHDEDQNKERFLFVCFNVSSTSNVTSSSKYS